MLHWNSTSVNSACCKTKLFLWFQKWTLYFALAAISGFLNDPIMHKSPAHRSFSTSILWVTWKHDWKFLYTRPALCFLLTFWNTHFELHCFDIRCHCVFSLPHSLSLITLEIFLGPRVSASWSFEAPVFHHSVIHVVICWCYGPPDFPEAELFEIAICVHLCDLSSL